MNITYFKVAYRNLVRQKAFSMINIAGLAVGLTTCLLIMLYIFDESSYDRSFQDNESVYRIATENGKGEKWAAGPAPLAAGLKNDLPEVAEATRLLTFPDIATMLIKYEKNGESKQFFEGNGYYVDANFFTVLQYKTIAGDLSTALKTPNSTVISTTLAEKLFGKENPVGKAILITTPFGEFNYTIKAVFDKHQNKSHIPANFFLSMQNNDMWNWVKNQSNWTTNNIFFTYVKLKSGTNEASFAAKLNPFFQHYAGADMKAAGFSKMLVLQPLKDIYLHSSMGNEISANGNITYLYILGSIATFILIIACINFMNLSTARSEKRAREVGVRKVMGAGRGNLVWQFLGESFLMCLMALAIALLLTWLILPVFNQLAFKKMNLFNEPVLVLQIALLTLLTGLLSGLYPAFYLSAFRPVAVLKGKIANNFSASIIRKGLVVFQFTISICLIFGAIVIWQQLGLLKNQQLGFQKEQQIILPLQQAYKSSPENYQPLRNELLKMPGVKSVTSGSTYPGIPDLNDLLFYPEGKTSSDMVDIHLWGIEKDYLETLGLQLIQGRVFVAGTNADSAGIILNETAVKQLGYENSTAIGKKIQYDFAGNHSSLEIVGIVKDYNFESLHNNIKPCGFTTGLFTNKYAYLIAQLQTKDISGMIASIEHTWNQLNPGTPFEFSFLDKDFQRNDEKEQQTSRIILYFTVIAILIASLGLFGLSAFSAEQRTKEIGIRKVLGASVVSVTAMLSVDFVKLIIVAMLIALPLATYLMQNWLQDFAYRISIGWWIYFAAGASALVIAMATISFQAIKAALANPVKSLKAE